MTWPLPAGNYIRPYRTVIVHKCGTEVTLPEATADLLARCPNWYHSHTCTKCGRALAEEFRFRDGDKEQLNAQ